MNLEVVMQAVSDQLDTIPGLRCFPYPVSKATPPWAMVLWPDKIKFDMTYRRGKDRIPALPVAVAVGKVSDRAAWKQLSVYCAGSGTSSVKQVLESGTYSAFHTIVVESVEFDVLRMGGVDYMGALFTLDIGGQGA